MTNATAVTSNASEWMERNLATQGYCLGAGEARKLRVGLRFPTALCLPFVVVGLVLESPLILVAMAAIGAVAGFTPRHPFDLLWNHGVRHLTGSPPLPPNPTRRRHAFKLGAAWLLVVAALFAVGLPVVALVVGGMLVAACTVVTVFNFCIPSYLLSLLERRREGAAATA